VCVCIDYRQCWIKGGINYANFS